MSASSYVIRCQHCHARLSITLDQTQGTRSRNAAMTCPRCQRSTLMAFPGKIVDIVRMSEPTDAEPKKRRGFWSFFRRNS